jgi:chromosome segregation ATPase
LQIIAIQAMPSLQKDGLPYWIFWFMLLIIVLLLLFIFLRDKRLRLRLSSFLAGARRRSVLLQLKYRLKRERQKKGNILRLLGEKAWDADIRIDGAENIRASLGALFKRRDADQMDAKNALAELEKLHKRMEESQALFGEKTRELRSEKQPFDERFKRMKEEKRILKKQAGKADNETRADALEEEIRDVAQRIDEFERSIKELGAEAKDQHHEMAREIHYWEKKKKKAQERIKEIEIHQDELYISFGRLLEKKKVGSLDLRGLYAEIDQVNQRIATLLHRIQALGGG